MWLFFILKLWCAHKDFTVKGQFYALNGIFPTKTPKYIHINVILFFIILRLLQLFKTHNHDDNDLNFQSDFKSCKKFVKLYLNRKSSSRNQIWLVPLLNWNWQDILVPVPAMGRRTQFRILQFRFPFLNPDLLLNYPKPLPNIIFLIEYERLLNS